MASGDDPVIACEIREIRGCSRVIRGRMVLYMKSISSSSAAAAVSDVELADRIARAIRPRSRR